MLIIAQVPTKHAIPLLKASRATLRSLEWRLQRKPDAELDGDDDLDDVLREEGDAGPVHNHPLLRLAWRSRAVWRLIASLPQLTQLVVDWAWEDHGDLFCLPRDQR